MLSGYQHTTLQGLGCGIDTQCGCCNQGMGDLLDPSTWGPADCLVAVAAGWIGWKLFAGQRQRSYSRKVVRRLTDE